MTFGPAQVHAQEHLGPIGRLRAARAGADAEDRVAVVVRTREEEARSLAREVGTQSRTFGLQAGEDLGVAFCLGELGELEQVIGA
jgi:hypothetical protein